MIAPRWFFSVVLIAALGTSVRAQTSYPMVTRVEPTAVQRGTTSDVVISGVQNLAGASGILFQGKGLTAVVKDEPVQPMSGGRRGRNGPGGSIKATISVDERAALGPREFRLVTPRGVSSVAQVVVVTDPVVPEANDKENDDPQKAQRVPLPSVVTGSVGKSEDVDWYAFEAKAGQTIVFSLWGNRLEDKIHDLQTHLDPILSLHDAAGRELAVSDNYYFADPMLAYQFKEDGLYQLQVRDATYAGNANWTYVLQATSGPYATSVFPMAVHPGETSDLHAIGFNFDNAQSIPIRVPSDVKTGPLMLPLETSEGTTPPVPLVATTLPLRLEQDDTGEEGEKAQALQFPSALNGRLADANDVDGYRFEATKGTTYAFEVVARRAGSQADPVLRLLDGSKGRTLTEVDDTFGKDPRIEWTSNLDGPVVLQIRDLHSRGGPGFGYVVLAEVARPDFVLTTDPDKLNVGPGSRAPLFVKVERRGKFNGPVKVTLDGVPAGLSSSPLTIPSEMTQGVIVVEASRDASPGAAMLSLRGEAEGPEGPIVRSSTPNEEIYLPGGGRGLFEVETLAAAVTEPSDILVEAKPTEVRLHPGETATIDVTIQRHEGFDKPVNLAVDLAHLGRIYASSLPPGVSFKAEGSKTLIGPKETTGKIVLEAKPNAPACPAVPITVMGHVSINFVVKTAYCSAPILVSVTPRDASSK